MEMKSGSAFILILLLSGYSSLAQQHLHWKAKHFTDENGLPQNSVKSIARTPGGFVWIATEDGLVRFDGNYFKRFGKEDVKLHSNRFQTIFPGSESNSIFVLNDRYEQARISENQIRKENDTCFWLKQWASLDFNIQIHTQLASGLVNPQQLANYYYSRVMIPAREQTCFIYGNGKMKEYRKDSLVNSEDLETNHHGKFFLLNNRIRLLQNDGTLRSFFPGKIQELEGDIVSDTGFKSGNRDIQLLWNLFTPEYFVLWINQRFYLAREINGHIITRLLYSGYDASANNISSALYDERTGILYLGSQTKGFTVISPEKFRTATRPDSENIYYSQLEYEPNKILSNASSLFDLSGSSRVLQPGFSPLRADYYSLFRDIEGYTWTRYRFWIYRYSPVNFQISRVWRFPTGIAALCMAKQGQLLIACGKDLYELKKPGQLTPPELMMRLPETVNFMVQQDEHQFIIGGAENLFILNTRTKSIHTIPEMKGRVVRHIYQAGSNEVWFATYGDGLILYRNGKYIKFPLDRAGYLSAAHCIKEDKNGYFWIPSNKGLFMAKRSDMLAWADGKTASPYYHYFDKSDGFNINEFNGGCSPCALTLSNGRITLPSMNGIVYFHPDSLNITFPEGELYLDKIQLNDNPVDPLTLTRLDREFGKLEIFVSTPFSGNHYNVQIEYALTKEGDNPVWMMAGENQPVSFSNIPSGRYELIIRKKKGFGTGNYAEKRLFIHVSNAWYNTAGFYITSLLLIIACIWGISVIRTRYVQRKNEQLEKIVAEKTKQLKWQADMQEKIINSVNHDIQTPMQYQRLMASRIYSLLLENKQHEALKYANEINNSTHRLYFMVENMLSYLKLRRRQINIPTHRTNLSELVEQKKNIFEIIAREKGTEIYNNVSPDIIIETDEQLISVILHNLLDNAVKITRNGKIEISAAASEDRWELTVSDSGPGISQPVINWINQSGPVPDTLKGLGLLMITELAQMIQLHLKAGNKPGGGAFITVSNS